MKKNKGFALIEIIMCIALLSTIAISSIIIFNKKNNDILKDINKKVSNAVDIYLNTKKDEDGDTYIEGINKGGQGLYINLKTLLDEGLIDKTIVNTLEKKENKKSEDLKILASKSISTTNTEECLGQIQYTFNWDNISSPIYLCPKNLNNNTNENFYTSLSSKNKIYELDGIDDNNYKYSVMGHSSISQSKENGIVKIKNDDNYYYRGVVTNNYVVFKNYYEKIDNNIDSKYLFRIIYFNKKNSSMKLISEEIKSGYSDQTCSNLNDLLDSLNVLSAGSFSILLSDNIDDETTFSIRNLNNEKFFYNQEICDINNYINTEYTKNTCENPIKQKISILSIYEALMIGTFNVTYTISCNVMNHSSCYAYANANMNFVSESDGTILYPFSTNKSSINYLSGFKNNFEYMNYGFLNAVPLNYDEACNNIRPTLLLNMNNLYIKSGSGLKTDPYVIDIKTSLRK